jgi:hypothetical protein
MMEHRNDHHRDDRTATAPAARKVREGIVVSDAMDKTASSP